VGYEKTYARVQNLIQYRECDGGSTVKFSPVRQDPGGKKTISGESKTQRGTAIKWVLPKGGRGALTYGSRGVFVERGTGKEKGEKSKLPSSSELKKEDLRKMRLLANQMTTGLGFRASREGDVCGINIRY